MNTNAGLLGALGGNGQGHSFEEALTVIKNVNVAPFSTSRASYADSEFEAVGTGAVIIWTSLYPVFVCLPSYCMSISGGGGVLIDCPVLRHWMRGWGDGADGGNGCYSVNGAVLVEWD